MCMKQTFCLLLFLLRLTQYVFVELVLFGLLILAAVLLKVQYNISHTNVICGTGVDIVILAAVFIKLHTQYVFSMKLMLMGLIFVGCLNL